MCGIFLGEREAVDEETVNLLRNRGPDHFNMVHVDDITVVSSVLSIRGSVAQPIRTDEYLLLYNGEIYNCASSDTLYLKEIVDSVYGNSGGAVAGPDAMSDMHIKSIYSKMSEDECEAAVVIKRGSKVFFFKDDIGRRSLGYTLNPFSVSSLGYSNEMDPLSIYCYDLSRKELHSFTKPHTPVIGSYLLNMESIARVLGEEKYRERYRFLEKYRENDGSDKALPRCEGLNGLGKGWHLHSSPMSSFEMLFLNAVKRRLIKGNIVVFFSGGVDSVLLTLFLHYVAHPSQDIFLINTAFSSSTTSADGAFDRAAGEAAHEELRDAFKGRRFFFIRNDVPAADIIKSHIHRLIAPKTHPMDFSIGATLYFTAREAQKYSRVAYLGSGADELFGGYSRYRGRNWRETMLFDMFTISVHNIGRDDRVVSDNRVECRFPFLDTEMVEFGLGLSDEMIISGNENKAVIREALRRHGLARASGVSKKAMQYGSGISRIEKELD
jgi:asparagine synthetase B (glutamine-hydrolysing)